MTQNHECARTYRASPHKIDFKGSRELGVVHGHGRDGERGRELRGVHQLRYDQLDLVGRKVLQQQREEVLHGVGHRCFFNTIRVDVECLEVTWQDYGVGRRCELMH